MFIIKFFIALLYYVYLYCILYELNKSEVLQHFYNPFI